MRSPSERLIQTLTAYKLCSREQLNSCEPIVRQLCHDLPDFDSIWLDALVQQRILTPWQAEQIQEDSPWRISAGFCQCLTPLGRSTFLARHTERRGNYVLRAVRVTDPDQRSVLDGRLEELLAALNRVRKSSPSGLVLPAGIERRSVSFSGDDVKSNTLEQEEVLVMSPYIAGWSVEELLIRGGRFPSQVVAEIGRELLAALSWLETGRLLHGDLVTRNVRLDVRGGVHLTSAFVRRIEQPQFVLSDKLTLRECEGVAPEQVGTGRLADTRSEIYALGCLLWQMLTSRPVVLTADPVSRLMKQKEQDIADVRHYVPDCPEWMSRLLLSMTRRSPELRPATAGEILRQWRNHSGGGLSQSRGLARSMPDQAMLQASRATQKSPRRAGAWVWPSAATAALGTLVFLSARSGILPQTLRVGNLAMPEEVQSVAGVSEAGVGGGGKMTLNTEVAGNLEPQPLPEADEEGEIRLEAGRSYLAEPREFAGTLRIVCDQTPAARVLISRGSHWLLRARGVELRGMLLMEEPGRSLTDPDSKASGDSAGVEHTARRLLKVQSVSLTVRDCVIQSPSESDEFEGISWLRPRGEKGVVVVRNTVFGGGGYGLSFDHPPGRCEFDNVLLANRVSGILCEFQKGDDEIWNIRCRNVTQRFGFSLCDAVVYDGGLRRLKIDVTSVDCVYAPRMAIYRFRIPGSWNADAIRIALRAGETGNPAVVPPATQPAIYIDQRLKQAVSLPESGLEESSVLLAELMFADHAGQESSAKTSDRSEWASSALIDFEGPKLTTLMPGVDTDRLPRTRLISETARGAD